MFAYLQPYNVPAYLLRNICDYLDESENADTPSGSIPGGMFAGVGQFPSIEREPAKPSTDLPELKYKAQSVLRLVLVLLHW